MKILICGDRNYSDIDRIEDFIYSLPKDTIIIEGECRGADIIARDIAEKLGMKVEKYPADWNSKYGRGSGVVRNKKMLEEGQPNYVIGFHNDVKNSKGTKHMLSISIKAGVPTYLNLASFVDVDLDIAVPLTLPDLDIFPKSGLTPKESLFD
jgi:hypothetical protein